MKTGTLQLEQGFPVMQTGFSLWELAHREFPVSCTGFGFTVHNLYRIRKLNLKEAFLEKKL